jgi:hypothetical protein
MKNAITLILSKLFPYNEPAGHVSVLMQETWLEKAMRPTEIKDHLWTPSKL